MSNQLVDDLKSSRAYPGPDGCPVDLIETHISWVFLHAHDAFKIKKPVNMGFLDFSTLDLRKRACEAEVQLNSRLAPDVYLGVIPVTRSCDGIHSIQGPGEIVDWAVHMKRLPDHDRADQRLARGELGTREVDCLARYITEFHAQSRCDSETARYGLVEVIERNINENFDQTRDRLGDYLSEAEASKLELWQASFLRSNRDRFLARMQRGRIRDGHGDLRLEQIYLSPDDRITILDCIEFNDRFRYADVCSDLAFLSMDLAFQGRVDLSERLIATYAREANDYDLYGLIDFYESYRAFVRGKVSTFLLADQTIEETTRNHARRLAKRYFLQTLSYARPALIHPQVIAVGGTLATGKSTIADWLGSHLGAPVIDADRTRKALLGVPPTQRVGSVAWSRAYSHAFTEKVYAEVFRRADVVLRSERSVILDATFRSRELRARARALAQVHGTPFHFIECRAPAPICRERLIAREREPSVSDARVDLLAEFTARFEPVTELPESEHLVLDTSRSVEETTGLLKSTLPLWPEHLTA